MGDNESCLSLRDANTTKQSRYSTPIEKRDRRASLAMTFRNGEPQPGGLGPGIYSLACGIACLKAKYPCGFWRCLEKSYRVARGQLLISATAGMTRGCSVGWIKRSGSTKFTYDTGSPRARGRRLVGERGMPRVATPNGFPLSWECQVMGKNWTEFSNSCHFKRPNSLSRLLTSLADTAS